MKYDRYVMTPASFYLDRYVYGVVAIGLSILAIILVMQSMIFHNMMIGTLFLVTGYMLWSLIEYSVHRWLFHGPYAREHGYHHMTPEAFIGFSNKVSLSAGALIAILFFSTLPVLIASTLYLGLILGYLRYLQVHDIVHHGPIIYNDALIQLRRHHDTHHKIMMRNFGVTTKLWDHVFNTTA